LGIDPQDILAELLFGLAKMGMYGHGDGIFCR